MKRIIVIGCPGSGKSRFSKELHEITDIPLYHLDMMYWNEDRTTVEKSVFLRRLREVLERDSWIIDGNYISTMEERICACDTVFFLDYPVEVCLDGIKERVGKARDDIPWVEREIDCEFVEFVKNFDVDTRCAVIALLEKYVDKSITVFKCRAEATAFLSKPEKHT